MQLEGKTAHDIMGSPDDIKLRSSMTLFAIAEGKPGVSRQVLKKYYRGEVDSRTEEILAQ